MADVKIIDLNPLTTQDLNDLYETSKNGNGSFKETRQQQINYLLSRNNVFSGINVNTKSIGSVGLPGVISAANMVENIVTMLPTGSGQTATFDSAANIYSLLGSPSQNVTFNFTLINIGNFDIPLSPGSNTLFNNMPSTTLKVGQTFDLQGTFTGISPLVLIISGGNQTPNRIPVITETTTARTLSSVDINSYIRTTNAATVSITVTSGIYSIGQSTSFFTGGSGQISFIAAGTTINSKLGNLKTNTTGSAAFLICTAANTFDLIGDLSV